MVLCGTRRFLGVSEYVQIWELRVGAIDGVGGVGMVGLRDSVEF